MRPSAAARCGLAALALARAAEDGATAKLYVAPEVEGLHWVETFDGDVWSRWTASSEEKYSGKFKVEKRAQEALVDDLGLVVSEEAKHYGAHVTFKPIIGQKETPFIVQFEVKFQESLTCGGSYIKIFDSSDLEGGIFKDNTPYVIMFGPDRCGGTDKVHFILRHKNPKTGAWEEKHAKDPPTTPKDNLTHLYGLVINPDNSFEIQVDGETKSSGSLLTSMQPPINPPKEIDDPEDAKPADWVDAPKMDDPSASKPDDWDEDAPMMIVDPNERKPAGWVDDAEMRIADPSAKKPEDWDEDEDGDWEAPVIDNPACKVGCGNWEAKKISNPEYKGKWYAPKIDNPEYKGVWKPRQIPNADYFLDESPYILPKIDAVGIDIWTMSKGLLFDNLLVATDAAKVKAFSDQTWRARKDLEDLQNPQPGHGSPVTWFMDLLRDNGISLAHLLVTIAVVLVTTVWCCCRGSDTPRAPTAAERRKLLAEAKAASAQDKGEEKEEAKQGEAAEAEDEGEEKEGAEKEEKEEGGPGEEGDED